MGMKRYERERTVSKRDWDMWFFGLQTPGNVIVVDGAAVPPDFLCSVKSIRAQILAEAQRRNVEISTELIRRGSAVRVRRLAGNARAGATTYRFDEWLDGQTHSLVGGVDYHCKTATVRRALGIEARARGLKIRTAFRDGVVWVQAL